MALLPLGIIIFVGIVALIIVLVAFGPRGTTPDEQYEQQRRSGPGGNGATSPP